MTQDKINTYAELRIEHPRVEIFTLMICGPDGERVLTIEPDGTLWIKDGGSAAKELHKWWKQIKDD